MFNNPAPAPLQLISDEEIDPWGVKLYIKREDLLHSEISGNKWRKLKYNFLEAKKLGFNKILTVGGAYSNHIAAVFLT
jgi:1-aminocyclopropane-1-carboxylate deaminase